MSITLDKYKQSMKEILSIYFGDKYMDEFDDILNYSIEKRLYNAECQVNNTYTHEVTNMNILRLADYINKKQPIVTAYGTMFMKHADCPNPMAFVLRDFLALRSKYKKEMYKYPKGSEDFEKYNLLQQLSKIDANGLYGVIGLYTSLLFNINVSSSVTSQGRALISSATMFFESFLANNVLFGSLDEVLEFINNIIKEKRIYDDNKMLDNDITVEDCFSKIILSCGYRWVPDEEEMDIIWNYMKNLGTTDINRIYYKNNLYEFMSNSSMIKAVKIIMKKLENPFFNPLDVPKEIEPELQELASILKEYVYYGYMYIDRIDRCDNMIKSVIMVSDTDSCIVSLDAWYRFVLDKVKDEELKIKKYDPINVLSFVEKDEFGDTIDMSKLSPIHFEEPEEHYDFENDELIMEEHKIKPFRIMPQDYLRYSIINIIAYVIDVLINDYMAKFTKNNHSYDPEDHKCHIILKNEFTFLRLLTTSVKKSYASLVAVQEGNIIPESERLDIKGIASMAKSSMSTDTRNAFKKILLEEILTADTVDQFKVIEQLAILERKIINNIQSGDKKYYKPVTVKSQAAYKDPMRNQGIKASYAWNMIKPDDLPAIDTSERNAIDIAKVNINKLSIETIKDEYPEVYEKALQALSTPEFDGKIESIAIPLDTATPKWLVDLIDYKQILNDNISGFVYDSIGLVNLGTNTNYSNILQL